MGGFLVPANAKRGTLIFNIFRPFDLILFGTGVAITFLLLALFQSTNIVITLISLLPGCICTLLILPIPNYHNVLCVLISVYNFYSGRRKYYWKGWCFYEEFKDDSESK